MGTTTVHIPQAILDRIDLIAKRRGVSRNRIVLESLEAEIARDSGAWPEEFFGRPSEQDLVLLQEATLELENTVQASRRNRGAMLL